MPAITLRAGVARSVLAFGRVRPFHLTLLLALTTATAAAVNAQEPTPPPPPPAEPSPAPPADPCAGAQARDPGCPDASRTSGGSSVDLGVLPPPTGSFSGSSAGGGLGNVDGEGALVLMVVAAIAAPLVIYAVDEPAEQGVLDRWSGPSAKIELTGGTVGGPGAGEWLGVFGARGVAGYGFLGLDTSLEASPSLASYSAADAHLSLRPPPRVHLEGAVSLGFRTVTYGSRVREGFDFSLPHRYVIFRSGPQSLGVDVRPGIFVGPKGADVRLETGFSVPLGERVALSAGARAFSFDDEVRLGFTASLSAAF